MTLYLEQISLTNSRIRLALKAGDSKTMLEASNSLCKGNHEKAYQLVKWFSKVACNCNENQKITFEIAMMRMWQLGNMDIKEISKEGKPIFILLFY